MIKTRCASVVNLAHARIALHVVHDALDEDASLVKDRDE